MMVNVRLGVYLALALLAILAFAFFSLGFHRPPNYIQNFEMDEYGSASPFIEPVSVVDGLAVYSIGGGKPVLLFPYPHGHTTEPMAQSPIARILVEMRKRVITFDAPGAYRSTREPDGTMSEMIQAADETLERLGIEEPVDVVGHSMSGFVALAFAVERPELTRRLVLANSVSGFPAAARCGYPGSAFNILDADYWRIILWGIRVNAGRADLAMHKRLQNLMAAASFHDESFFTPVAIEDSDRDKGVPIRMIWSKNMYTRLSYADRLDEVTAPTLVLAGRHDPEAGLACANELYQGVAGARLIIFEESGHAPFIEEVDQFAEAVGSFLNGGGFALYVLPTISDPRLVDASELADVQLDTVPLVAENDILNYDLETHEMMLTEAAYTRVTNLFSTPVDVNGMPFVVTVDAEPIYAGAFYTPASSISYDGVVIMQPIATATPTIQIGLGYPSVEAFTGPDPRSDPRVATRLQLVNKAK